jgi:hypothetical protein
MKGVLDTQPHSGYDDEVRFRYDFPNNYLPVAEQLGSLSAIELFREPPREGGHRRGT